MTGYVFVVVPLLVIFTPIIFGRNVGKFWQVTDFHYDSNYSVRGDTRVMCHNDGKMGPELGTFGDYHCDAPWKLVVSAVQAMKKIEPKPDFILWTGDSIPHINASEYNLPKTITTIGNITSLLLSVFPDQPVFPVLGNHDPYPSNQMPFSSYNNNGQQYYEAILDTSGWKRMLGSDQQKVFTAGGFYSTVYEGWLRLLCLNTNLYYRPNLLVRGIPDPAYQFAWMENQLAQARGRGQKVYIVAHIAPGAFELTQGEYFFYHNFNLHYVDIVRRYNDVILGQFYGHEHTDSFRVLYNNNKTPVGQMFLSPAVTPWTGSNNPSVRLYHYDTDTGQVLDVFQYYLNLTEANFKAVANWQLEYQATKDFSIPDVTPKSLNSLVQTFQPHSKNFNKYLLFNRVSYITDVHCNASCHRTQICSITEVDLPKYFECVGSVHPTSAKPHESTTGKPESTSHNHVHGKRPVPRFMLYVIGGLVGIVLLLFIVIAVLCVGRSNHISPPRFTRLPVYATGPIN